MLSLMLMTGMLSSSCAMPSQGPSLGPSRRPLVLQSAGESPTSQWSIASSLSFPSTMPTPDFPPWFGELMRTLLTPTGTGAVPQRQGSPESCAPSTVLYGRGPPGREQHAGSQDPRVQLPRPPVPPAPPAPPSPVPAPSGGLIYVPESEQEEDLCISIMRGRGDRQQLTHALRNKRIQRARDRAASRHRRQMAEWLCSVCGSTNWESSCACRSCATRTPPAVPLLPSANVSLSDWMGWDEAIHIVREHNEGRPKKRSRKSYAQQGSDSWSHSGAGGSAWANSGQDGDTQAGMSSTQVPPQYQGNTPQPWVPPPADHADVNAPAVGADAGPNAAVPTEPSHDGPPGPSHVNPYVSGELALVPRYRAARPRSRGPRALHVHVHMHGHSSDDEAERE